MRLFRRNVRDPAWGLEPGDVLALDLPTGAIARLQIVSSQPPDKEYDYRRLTARLIEPEGVDLSGEYGNDSIVPVGTAAEPIEISLDPATAARDLAEFFAATMPRGEGGLLVPASTPGLVVVVPDDEGGSAEDPTLAGFRLAQRGAAPVQADGQAVLMQWSTLAERLRSNAPSG